MANEKRLIDANALKNQHTYLWDEALGTCECVLVEDIENAPTIDAVGVVRCKDCKHYGYEPYDNGDKCCVRWEEWIFPFENDFCSYGERKDNETD